MNMMLDLSRPREITRTSLRAMPLGAMVESEGLFQGISNEPVIWELVDKITAYEEYTFDLTYYSVHIAQVHVWAQDDNLRMEEM